RRARCNLVNCSDLPLPPKPTPIGRTAFFRSSGPHRALRRYGCRSARSPTTKSLSRYAASAICFGSRRFPRNLCRDYATPAKLSGGDILRSLLLQAAAKIIDQSIQIAVIRRKPRELLGVSQGHANIAGIAAERCEGKQGVAIRRMPRQIF